MDAPEPKHEPKSEKNKSGVNIWAVLGQRFALKKIDLMILLAVVLFIGGWVNIRHWAIKRGHVSSGEMLGRPLRVGIATWPGYAGGLTANNGRQATKDSDFWNYDHRKLLVEFQLVEDEAQLIDKLAKDENDPDGVDVIWSTVDSLARQYPEFLKRGVRPRAFMQVDWSRGADAIVTNADIRRPEQLKGKRVAVSMAASQWLLEYTLESSNLLEPGTAKLPVSILRTGGSKEAFQEFEAHRVDAAVLWEPYVTEAQKDGRHVLVDTSMATNLIADIMVANEEFIREHKDVIYAFMEGWLFGGTPKAQIDPMLAAHVLQDEPDFQVIGEEKTRRILDKVALATFQDNIRMFGLSGDRAIFDELFNRASVLWLKRGYIATQIPAGEARDSSFLEELYMREVYNGHMRPMAKTGCGRIVWPKKIPVAFKPGSAALEPDAERSLDNEDLGFQIRALSGVRFCIQVAGEENNIQLPSTLVQARSNSVIDYLSLRYGRPRSDFVPVDNIATSADDDRSVPSILLKIVDPKQNEVLSGDVHHGQ